MIKKYHFKPYVFIIALAAILISPVLVNAQAQQGSADGSPPSMEKCMRATGGDQAKCAAKWNNIKAGAPDDRSHRFYECLSKINLDSSPFGMQPRFRHMPGRIAYCTKEMKTTQRSQRSEDSTRKASPLGLEPGTSERGEKASPLCNINPRHLKKKSLGERKRRCN